MSATRAGPERRAPAPTRGWILRLAFAAFAVGAAACASNPFSRHGPHATNVPAAAGDGSPLPAPAAPAGSAATVAAEPPRLVERDGRFALLVDGEPYLMLVAQANNSSNYPAALPAV